MNKIVDDDVRPLYALVESRRKELNLSWPELVRRCGYRNIGKGLNRFNDIWQGSLHSVSSAKILTALPAALELDADIVQDAVRQSEELLQQSCDRAKVEADKAAAAANAKWRASFKPEAYLLGTASRPSQITIYGMTGGPRRWLRIPLDVTKSPVTFAEQALAVVRQTPVVPFFGPTTGFVVNYTPDAAIQFDLEGQPVAAIDHAYIPGESSLTIGSQPNAADELIRNLGLV